MLKKSDKNIKRISDRKPLNEAIGLAPVVMVDKSRV